MTNTVGVERLLCLAFKSSAGGKAIAEGALVAAAHGFTWKGNEVDDGLAACIKALSSYGYAIMPKDGDSVVISRADIESAINAFHTGEVEAGLEDRLNDAMALATAEREAT